MKTTSILSIIFRTETVMAKVLHKVVGFYLLLIIFGGFSSYATAGLQEKQDISKMAQKAELIIRGKVIHTKSQWEEDSRGRHIYTSVTVKVLDKIKGNLKDDVFAFEVVGGTVDDIREFVSDTPAFEIDEDAIMFFGGQPLTIQGGINGKISIYNGKVYREDSEITADSFIQAIRTLEQDPNALIALGEEYQALAEGPAAAQCYIYSGIRWCGTSPIVPYKINENTSDCTCEGDAVQRAADTWNNACDVVNFEFEYGGSHTHTSASQNYVNEIMWGATADSVATTTTWYNTTTMCIVECDVVFNDSYSWSCTTPTSSQMDVETVALHEFGHWLNLSDLYDPDDECNVMYGYVELGQIKRELRQCDVDGICYIYGCSGDCYGVSCRCCECCEPEDSYLGTIGTTVWGYSVSGNCGNGGKWVGQFTGEVGKTYHFDLCPDSPGSGTANFDADIKITNNSCSILTGVDGSCSSPSYVPNDFQWTCSSSGTYYVIIAPYSSYYSHNCTGTASDTFTLKYYKEGDGDRPCENCEPEDVDLGAIGTTVCGYSVSGNCGNGGKWVGQFTGEAGAKYHFDLCPDSPCSGTANFDADIKITNSSCNILAGEDGSCSLSNYYRPNDFTWICPSNGTYYVIIAPYNSYYSHNCTGTASNTFTLKYYKEACSPPSPPTGVSATDGTYCDRIRVSWNSVSGATGYEIWRNTTNNSGSASYLSDDSSSPYDDYSATAGVTYYYWVKAKNGCGTSGFSSSNSGYRAESPAITQHPQDATVYVGGDADFSVTATGSAPLHYQWKKNGGNIGTDSPALTLYNVQLSDNGAQIACDVNNACGTATSNIATLTVPAVFDDFNDNVQGRMWKLYEDDHNHIWLDETNQRLEVRANTSANDEDALYGSDNWGISTTNDFQVKIDFYYDLVTSDWGEVFIGIAPVPSDSINPAFQDVRDNHISFAAGCDDDYPVFWYEQVTDGILGPNDWAGRDSNSGTLYISYDYGLDELYLSSTGYGDSNAWKTFSSVIQGQWGQPFIGIGVGGNSYGVSMASGDAYLDNFIIEEGEALNIYPDFDDDNDVDFVDFATFANEWMQSGCGLCEGAEFTGDGNIGISDLAVLADHWLEGF